MNKMGKFNIKLFFIILTIILALLIAAKPVYVALKAIIKNISGLG